MATVTNNDLILQLKKIMIWRIQNKCPNGTMYRVGVNKYTKDEFIKLLEDDTNLIFGQFIQKLAEEGFDAFKMGVNVDGFQIIDG